MTPEEARVLIERTKQKAKSPKGEKTQWIRPPSEANKKFTFRILPYTDKGDFTVLKWYHWGVGQNMKTECTKDEHCPVCQVLSKYRKDNWKKITKYLPKGQAFFNVQLPEQPDKVYLLSMSESFLDWLMNAMIEAEITDLFDAKTGRDIIIWRKSDKGAFERMIALKSRPIAETDEDIEAILNKTVNLDTYFKPMTDEDLIKASISAQELDKKLRATIMETDEEDIQIEEIPNSKEEQQIEKPKECFGNFNSSDKNCLLCEYASDCMTSK